MPWQRLPALTLTAAAVAADPAGPDVLYRGKYAAGLVADIRAAGGHRRAWACVRWRSRELESKHGRRLACA